MASSKTYLNVPYAEKDAAKALGAKWDSTKKKWYAPKNGELSTFKKWHTKVGASASTKTTKASTSGSSLKGVITYAKDKGFIAYSGDQPPWESH